MLTENTCVNVDLHSAGAVNIVFGLLGGPFTPSDFLFYKMRKNRAACRRQRDRFLYNQQKNSKKGCEIWLKCIIMDVK